MTVVSPDSADRLTYLKTCREFIPCGSRASRADPDGPVYLELVEVASSESLGMVFPNGFMTAVKCLEAYAASPGRTVSPGLRAQMQKLASRLHDGRCGYRFFQDSQRYPEDVDSTALVNTALLINGDLPPARQALAQARILASRVDEAGFSVWLVGGRTNRPVVRDAVVDMNAFGALVLLNGGGKFRASFESAAARALSACEAEKSLYYNNLEFVRDLRILWTHFIEPDRHRLQRPPMTDRFVGEIIAQHRDGSIGYVIS